MLLAASFPEAQWQQQIALGQPLGSTTPDCFFPSEDPDDPGVCIYLDGLSEHIHGNPTTAARDRAIREELRARYYEVFEIAASELDDRAAMTRHFYKLGQLLLGKDKARGIRQQSEWFERRRPVAATSLYGEGSEDAEPEAGLAAADREEVGSGAERRGA